MKNSPKFWIIYLVPCLLLLCLNQANALSSRDKVLSGVSFSEAEGYRKIKVSFHFPVRYLRHYPLNNGREVRIQFEPIAISAESRAAMKKRESLIPPANNPAGVSRVEYEGNDFVQPTVRIVFTKALSYEARQGDDFRSLAVLVPQAVAPVVLLAGPAEDQAGQQEAAEPFSGPKPISSNPLSLGQEQQQQLLTEGVQVMKDENYDRAIQVYTRLLDSEDAQVVELAQYQLALAQEKKGHLAHAKAEYKNYLRAYADGKYAVEAKDSLRKLLSAKPLRIGGSNDATGRDQSLWDSQFFGSISQYYDRDESFSEGEESGDKDESIVNYSTLTTSIDATYRLQTEKYRFELVGIGSFEADLEEDDDETRVSSLYLDFSDDSETIVARLGRQSSSKGGVLGRFDGGSFGYLLTEKVRMNLVAGFPVERTSDDFQEDKYFYGINFDLGSFWQHWEFNTYFINQVADDIDDRRAVGLEVRYLGERASFFSLFDYDLLFDQPNIFLFSGNYLLPNDRTRLNVSADFRRSPSLSASNALIGQVSPSLETLKESIGEDELQKLAEDRSLESSYVTVGFSHSLTERMQLAADVAWSKLDGSPASGGVEAIESTGDEFYYTVQLLTDNFIMTGDLTTVSLRYADTKKRDTYTLIVQSRLPLGDRWKINPKLQVDYRENKELTGDQWRIRPSLRLEYAIAKSLHFEIDGEYSWANEELEGIAEDRKGYTISAGLRWDF